MSLYVDGTLRTSSEFLGLMLQPYRTRRESENFYRATWTRVMAGATCLFNLYQRTTGMEQVMFFRALLQSPFHEYEYPFIIGAVITALASDDYWDEVEDSLISAIYNNPFYWENFESPNQ